MSLRRVVLCLATVVGLGGVKPALALSTGGVAVSWGYKGFGQLGNGSFNKSSLPTPVDAGGLLAGQSIVAIFAGDHHALVLGSDGKVYAWGGNANGELGSGRGGDGSYAYDSDVPIAVDGSGVFSGKIITAVAVGYGFSLMSTVPKPLPTAPPEASIPASPPWPLATRPPARCATSTA